jgi:hypothetical protein
MKKFFMNFISEKEAEMLLNAREEIKENSQNIQCLGIKKDGTLINEMRRFSDTLAYELDYKILVLWDGNTLWHCGEPV